MEAERDKDNHGRASEIFSGSMASGSYLLLDGAANRLKLPLSLCQDENVQLYFPTEEMKAGILCGRQLFSTDTRWTVELVKLLFSLLFYCLFHSDSQSILVHLPSCLSVQLSLSLWCTLTFLSFVFEISPVA